MTEPAHERTWRYVPTVRASLAFLVHSNLFISLSAASVAVTTTLLADLPPSPWPPAIVFGVTMFVYSANRVLDLAEDAQNVPTRAAFTRRYGRHCLAVGATLYAGAVAAAVALSVPGVAFMLLPLVVTVLYSVVGLKRYYLVKNLLVGVSWGLIPLGVGVYFGSVGRFAVWVLAGWVTCTLTVAAMVFDLKDVAGDRAEGIDTVPVRHGPATTRRVAGVANAVLAGVVVALVVLTSLPPTFLVLLPFHLYVGGYVAAARPDRGPLFYGFVVDGEHVFLAAIVFVLELLPALGL